MSGSVTGSYSHWMVFNSLWKKRTGDLGANSSRRMVTSIKKKNSAPGRFRCEQRTSVPRGLAGQQRATPTLPSIKALWRIAWSYICLWAEKKPLWLGFHRAKVLPPSPPFCSRHLYPHLASFTCKDTDSSARHNGALVPTAALQHCCNHSNKKEELPLLI